MYIFKRACLEKNQNEQTRTFIPHKLEEKNKGCLFCKEKCGNGYHTTNTQGYLSEFT